MYGRHAIFNELLGDVGQSIAVALQRLFGGKGPPLADLVKHVLRPVGNPAIEFTVRVAIEGSTRWIRRLLIYVRHLEGFAVVERRVAPAMMDRDRMVLRYLIEVVNVELPFVLYLGVVEKIPFDPGARRRLVGSRTEFVNDAVDGHELDHVRISDQHLIEQYVARRMIVTVDETWHDRHLLGIQRLSSLADESLDVLGVPHCDEPAGLHRE